ncbi:MAG: MFS transporter [Oscillospiraceae bacterium]|jgi:Na+/melibiose symporter-like transporter|nr:MFS transporter [Oscillospiraceae bacterium]
MHENEPSPEEKQNPRLRKVLTRFKVSEPSQDEAVELLHHPVRWMKGGDNLPAGHLAPWEKLLFGLNGFLGTSAGGFNGQDRLFRYTFHVDPNHLTISGTISSVWDAVNDPIIGSFMDRHPWSDKTYRWICRANQLLVCVLNVIILLDLGLTPLQHVVLLTVFNVFKDVLGTFAGVSYSKYFAGITPFSNERGKTIVWNNVGNQCGYPIANIPNIIMGFARDRMKFSDYRIYVYGTLILFPIALIAGWLPTYARNRVHFHPEEKELEKSTPPRSLREKIKYFPDTLRSIGKSFSILKHNNYLILNSIASFITVFTPSSDDLPIYRYIMPKYHIGSREMRGEALIWFKKQFSGLPITILYPFLGVVVNKVGGPKRMHLVNSSLQIVCNLIKFVFDPRRFKRTIPPLIMITFMDAFFETLGPLDGYASGILTYEMYDYVEYKTGVRSEGISTAFNALFSKMITGNINNATYNAFQSWSGINKVDYEKGDPAPARYLKYAWALFCLAPVADSAIWLIARLLFKYDPKQKAMIEAELMERRALAARQADALADETEA